MQGEMGRGDDSRLLLPGLQLRFGLFWKRGYHRPQQEIHGLGGLEHSSHVRIEHDRDCPALRKGANRFGQDFR